MKKSIFAPGVVKLFGEHAVVYGKPAIAAAIDKGVYIDCISSDKLVVETAGITTGLRFFPLDRRVEAFGAERFFAYVEAALRLAQERWGDLAAKFIIRSDLPPSAGAATSAAVSVGILKAYALCAGAEVRNEEVAKLGHKVELEVQGIASPMDTATVTYGGVLKILTNPFRAEPLKIQLPPFYIVLLPRLGTTGEIVKDVRALLGRRKSATWVIEAIGKVVEEAENCLEVGDLECVGELMDINNWLLGALGVVDGRVVDLLGMLKPFIYGGKISGAGRGGVVILLPKEGDVVSRILKGLGYPYYKVSVYPRGVGEV